MRLLPRIPTTAQLRALEAEWIKKCDLAWGQVLMELAGKGAAEIALAMWGQMPGKVAVVCGRGNNGGDGFVVARFLKLWNVDVSVYVVTTNDTITMNTQEAEINRKIAVQMGIPVSPVPDDLSSAIYECTLIVDALLGTGMDRPVEGKYKDVIDRINLSGKPVLAIDLPSGIDSDTGHVLGSAIRADRTVTFGYLKPGLLQHPGATLAGPISTIDIGLPAVQTLPGAPDPVYLTTGDFVRGHMPARPTDSHKGTFGSVLMVGGSAGMFGATILASETALRTGAGLSILAAPKSVVAHLPAAEVIYKLLPETTEATISMDAIKALEEELDKVASIILGPGMTQNPETIKFVQALLPLISERQKSCIVDADALNAISTDLSKFPKKGKNFVLTPHPKELSRLMKSSVTEIQEDRIASARKAATKFGCTVVLKGSRTVIAQTDGTVFINPTGNPGMATAGSGDVLSGVIGGLMAQGMPPSDAAVCGVYIHGLAGDLAATAMGDTGILAGEIGHGVPLAINHIRQGMISALELQLNGSEG